MSLKKTSGSVAVGTKSSIGIKVAKGVSIKKKTYTSSNKKIATVSSKGVIKGIKVGNTTIKVKVSYSFISNGKKKNGTTTLKYKVCVKKKGSKTSTTQSTQKNTSSQKTTEKKSTEKKTTEQKNNITLSFDRNIYEVKEGESVQLNVSVSPANTPVNLKWELLNVNNEVQTGSRWLATINQSGVVTGNAVTKAPVIRARVTDTNTNSSALALIKVNEGKYVAKYNYEGVYLLSDLMIGGTLGSFNANHTPVYIKTNNPGDRKFTFETDFFDLYESCYDFNDLNCRVEEKNNFKYCSVKEGLVTTLYSTVGESDSWKSPDYNMMKNIYNNCSGRITLYLYEHNSDAIYNSSDNYKKTLVWKKTVPVKCFSDELDKWILYTLIPSATNGKTYDSDFDKYVDIVSYMKNIYFRYLAKKTSNISSTYDFMCEAGAIWESRGGNLNNLDIVKYPTARANSEASPLIAIRIANLMGYEADFSDNIFEKTTGVRNAASHSSVSINCNGEWHHNIETCPNGNIFPETSLPPKQDIDYFIKLYNASMITTDPLN